MRREAEIVIAITRVAGAREALQLAAQEGDDKTVGRRTLLLLWLIDPAAIGTQRILAKRMGVSESRVSRMVKSLRRGLLKELRGFGG